MMVAISLVSPSAVVRGLLRNLFLEPQAHLFVGSINSRQLNEILSILEKSECSGVVVVPSNKHPIGVRIKQLGHTDRSIIEYDGIQLIQKPLKSNR